MAEREGFEPSVPVRVRVLSRDVPSATQPSFQYFNNLELVYSSKFFSSIYLHIRVSITKKNPLGNQRVFLLNIKRKDLKNELILDRNRCKTALSLKRLQSTLQLSFPRRVFHLHSNLLWQKWVL